MAVRTIGKKKKFKFKWTIELLILGLFFLLFIILNIVLSLPSDRDAVINAWKDNVSMVTDMRKISEDKLEQKIKNASDNEYIFVFYGNPDDDSSKQNVKTIDSKLYQLNEKIKKIDDKLPRLNVYWLDSKGYFDYKDKESSAAYHYKIKEKYEKFNGLDFNLTGKFYAYLKDKLIKVGDDISISEFVDAYFAKYFDQVTKK